MTIEQLVKELKSDTQKTKLIYDFHSKFLQISTWKGDVIWSGQITDLKHDELCFEVIPTLLESE